MRLKAWTSRVLTAFLAVCLNDLSSGYRSEQRDRELSLSTAALVSLADWMLTIERSPRLLTSVQANDLEEKAWRFLGWWCVYIIRSKTAFIDKMFWPFLIRTKVPGYLSMLGYFGPRKIYHAVALQTKVSCLLSGPYYLTSFCCSFVCKQVICQTFFRKNSCEAFIELNASMKQQLYCIRFQHCYCDEDTVGTMKGLAKRVHHRLMELRMLLRWLLRLNTYMRH